MSVLVDGEISLETFGLWSQETARETRHGWGTMYYMLL